MAQILNLIKNSKGHFGSVCVCVCVHAHVRAHLAVSASLQPHGLYVAHQAPLLTDKSKSPQIMF